MRFVLPDATRRTVNCNTLGTTLDLIVLLEATNIYIWFRMAEFVLLPDVTQLIIYLMQKVTIHSGLIKSTMFTLLDVTCILSSCSLFHSLLLPDVTLLCRKYKIKFVLNSCLKSY